MVGKVLPLWGHSDTDMFDIDRENEGNFRALLSTRFDAGDLK